MTTNKFVMVGHPRTGSTLLRELLIQHPDVLMFSELFHPLVDERSSTHAFEADGIQHHYADEQEDAFSFLDRLVWNPANCSTAKAIGFKLFARYVQAPGTARLFARLKDEHADIRVIHLVRNNLLDVWVSTKLAERSGVWKIGTHADRSAFDATAPFVSDPWEMKEFFEFSIQMTDFFRRHFGPGQYLEINYDQLVASTDETLLGVFSFLGVSPLFVQVPLQKQNRRSHRQMLQNFVDLEAFFADTDFACHFAATPAADPPPAMPAEAGPRNSGATVVPSSAVETPSEVLLPATDSVALPTQYESIRAAAQSLSVHRWIDEVGKSLDTRQPQHLFNVPMPTSPSEDFQRIFVGSAGTPAALEAGVFFRHVRRLLPQYGITNIARLLDFGCGWGRLTRLFLREVPQKGLFGADLNPWGIESCRKHVPQACFVQTEVFPPLPFRDQIFDVVIAYSVFSHLPELTAHAWIGEIARVLRPGGVLLATTHPLWMLDLVRRLRDGEEPTTSPWHESLVHAWVDTEAATAQYHAGGFLYAKTNAGEEHYGDTMVSPGYIRRVWGNILEPLDFISDPDELPQAAFVMRKRT